MKRKSITVIAITNQNVNQHAQAIDITVRNIPRKNIKKVIVSPTRPTIPFDGEWFSHECFSNWTFPQSFNNFLTTELNDFITTTHCITVHHDGYGINKRNWSNRFLDYDYIGAPWPQYKQRVGNGGFCLRSKKWTSLCQSLPLPNKYPEDLWTTNVYHNHFISNGCKIAPIRLALKFSTEAPIPEMPNHKLSDSFGFHHPQWHNRKDLILL